MNQSAYYGHESQLFGVEEVRLQGGKGDGMRLLQVRNGKGLEFTVSADRCADISRLIFRGENCGFFLGQRLRGPGLLRRQGRRLAQELHGGLPDHLRSARRRRALHG